MSGEKEQKTDPLTSYRLDRVEQEHKELEEEVKEEFDKVHGRITENSKRYNELNEKLVRITAMITAGMWLLSNIAKELWDKMVK